MKTRSTGFALNAAVFLVMLGVGMIMAILPQRVIGGTGSSKAVAWITAAFAIPHILLQFAIGRLSDRFGPRPAGYYGLAAQASRRRRQ
jgi:MFS family permease